MVEEFIKKNCGSINSYIISQISWESYFEEIGHTVNSKGKGHAADNDISLIYVKHLC